jgi:uroporphyrinogen-III synthase
MDRSDKMPDPHPQPSPLQSKRVLVTRTRDQAGTLSANLLMAGAIPIEMPVIRIVPPPDWQPLDQALRTLVGTSTYDWLVFTSANGVKMVLERLRTLGFEPYVLHGMRIATIGPATAATLKKYGLSAALVPAEYIAESMAEALHNEVGQSGETLQGKRILLSRAAEARQVLVTALEQAGAQVDVVVAYQTLSVSHDDERGREVIALLRQKQLDIITFTSSSTVHHFMHWLSQSAPDLAILLSYPGKREMCPLIACIGPVTASTARSYGLQVAVEAHEFTTAGLVEALIDYQETLK